MEQRFSRCAYSITALCAHSCSTATRQSVQRPCIASPPSWGRATQCQRCVRLFLLFVTHSMASKVVATPIHVNPDETSSATGPLFIPRFHAVSAPLLLIFLAAKHDHHQNQAIMEEREAILTLAAWGFRAHGSCDDVGAGTTPLLSEREGSVSPMSEFSEEACLRAGDFAAERQLQHNRGETKTRTARQQYPVRANRA